jgi:phage shock protein E
MKLFSLAAARRRKRTAREIARDEVRALIARGVPLVDVLPSKEFEQEHIVGALGIPLARLDREAPERLRRDAPVIVYCNDYQ